MALKIEVADLGLPALDALDVDAVGVFVGPERPLQGLAGFVDWRMCGAISRAIRNGLFEGARGEALLLPTGGRMGPARLFCFGLPDVSLAPEAFLPAARAGLEALARAGSEAFAISMPSLSGGDAALAARLWVEASLTKPVRRQVVLGDARQLQRDLSTARNTLAVEVEVIAPPTRVEMPRARALPHVGGVLRAPAVPRS
ncbi:M17 family peptidase N-terminal domain-containing protein [Anaeromyxobacter sp. Fw109-5]|uniref:M17 family peptidase N-terminal domain-containing protein n=1 Tax=Anaeromyxobacter sp. (strain Fw109-5) TaxID=404589 RepID=UPI000158A79F|nr:M17 family peptidase N-terminal domain-containing protein [Anaeromyxobacter sp. Fw109-5]ABS26927.1 peptidase M17 leucyl aminopeptidase domain protein [Anaeromyxobacter sp. Fw109-5]